MNVLVTGGAGYIGSHTMVELLNAGHSVVCIDNFMNSKFEAVRRVEKITGKPVKFYEGDIRDREILKKIFEENKIDSLQEEVDAVLIALRENEDLSKLMNHPKITKEEKAEW